MGLRAPHAMPNCDTGPAKGLTMATQPDPPPNRIDPQSPPEIPAPPAAPGEPAAPDEAPPLPPDFDQPGECPDEAAATA